MHLHVIVALLEVGLEQRIRRAQLLDERRKSFVSHRWWWREQLVHGPQVDDTAWEALSDYGAALGLAFQVVDDILDVTQESHTLGKTAGKDVDNNKPTYVSVLGLSRARAHALELREHAQSALARSALTDTSALAMLADKVVERDN